MPASLIKWIVLILGAIIGVLAALFLPQAIGLDQGLATLVGSILFIILVFGYQMVSGTGDPGALADKIKALEKSQTALKADLEKAVKGVEEKTAESNARNDRVVSELKLLQTLLGQVVKKQSALKGGAAKPSPKKATQGPKPAAKPEQASPKSVDSPQSAPPSQDDEQPVSNLVSPTGIDDIDNVDIDDSDSDEDVILETESADPSGSIPERNTGATPRSGRPKAAIRLIKKEEQLLDVVQSALSENRVDLYLQSIVGLPSRRTMHYECFSRVRDEEGRIVLPRQYIRLAEDKGLIGTIDNLLLFRLIQLVRRLGPRLPDIRFFCNLSRHSMQDQEFFPQFIDFMLSSQELADRLVFEITQADYEALDGNVADQLQRLGRRGFGFSLDHVSDLQSNFAALAKQHFRYLKVEMPFLASSMEMADIQEMVKELRHRGMSLITSRMENEDLVLQALDAEIELAQGYIFGEPRSANDMGREF